MQDTFVAGHCQIEAQLVESADGEPVAQLPRISLSPEIISLAVWLYHRLCLSFRDVGRSARPARRLRFVRTTSSIFWCSHGATAWRPHGSFAR